MDASSSRVGLSLEVTSAPSSPSLLPSGPSFLPSLLSPPASSDVYACFLGFLGTLPAQESKCSPWKCVSAAKLLPSVPWALKVRMIMSQKEAGSCRVSEAHEIRVTMANFDDLLSHQKTSNASKQRLIGFPQIQPQQVEKPNVLFGNKQLPPGLTSQASLPTKEVPLSADKLSSTEPRFGCHRSPLSKLSKHEKQRKH